MSNIDQIRQLIAKGETEIAIEELIQFSNENSLTYTDEIILISNRIQGLDQQVFKGTISNQDFNIYKNQINDSILSLCSKIEKSQKDKEKVNPPNAHQLALVKE